ncbi:hypothetical protein [Halosimplex pelagicum]|uniref:DUF8069 domain-containing protein n=1 Tax=Halosimplex pelagicum TaxID=869886 RepID=A0A7D5PAI1_9EURY|nr:hypothetical protein [Halosimplex pelagicum]QLH84803.1 hypothetical protein HZS54_25645 [Halosimplex pelagicum]
MESEDSNMTEDVSDDISEAKARMIVEQLIERGVVHMPENEPKLIHEPTGRVFHSNESIAHFHKGWESGRQTHCK